MAQRRIVIVGAGLVGSLLSIYLAKRGHRVDVYERRPDMRREDIPAGRSINLAMSDRGWRGLERAGIIDAIRPIAIPMRGRMMHDTQGNLTMQPYGTSSQAINSVSRRTLNVTLMDCAESYPNTTFHFDMRAIDIALDAPSVLFEHTYTGQQHSVDADVVVAADGAFSAIRYKMQHIDRFDFSQTYLEHGYKELVVPAGPNGEFMLEKNYLHIWARHSFMMIALPNTDATFTCTIFLPFQGHPSFDSIKTEEQIRTFFNKEFPDAVPLMPTLMHDFIHNPASSLATMRTYPWVWNDKVALIGDAAHAVVPFYGQGMNCGFEDCVELAECIDVHPDDWVQAFRDYQNRRKPNSDAIATLAVENFIEMRDKVADPNFLLRKKIEAQLHEWFPDKYTPQYTLVSFSPDVPYSEAMKRGRQNDALIDRIMSMDGIAQKWQSEEVRSTVAAML